MLIKFTMPKSIVTPSRSRRALPWAGEGFSSIRGGDKSGFVMAYLVDNDLHTPDGFYFLKSKYLTELGDRLRATMIFEWMSGVFGRAEDATISREDITSRWAAIADNGYFGSTGTIGRYYINGEETFWRELLSN